jgi:DNA-binding CsgD family transcriptional regulator
MRWSIGLWFMTNLYDRILKKGALYLILLFLLLAIVDIFREYISGESLSHLSFEVFVCIAASLWSLGLWWSWKTADRKLNHEISERLKLNKEYLEWKTKNLPLLNDIHSGINAQFSTWGLTPAESDVAFLLLKGVSFKEIAELRGSTEKTVRHHALKIYQKSGLPGRTELFAYFFEDILGPRNPS